MPTVVHIGPYKLYFYSAEGIEPPHIHIRRDHCTTKFWLSPVSLAQSRWFSNHELRWLRNLVQEYEQVILEAWDEYFTR